jgi:glyoxylase-like metal-dependent hydrolase (beta-lactamase superfamily II)
MAKPFASQGDLAAKKTSFTKIGPGLYPFIAEGDPNSDVIFGDTSVMVTDKPISHVMQTHYHAVRVLGASAFHAREIIMLHAARGMVAERGTEERASEFTRFPRLFDGHENIPGLTWPTTTFTDRMTVDLGKRRVNIMHLGRAQKAGDAVVHVPDANVMFTGDIVEDHSACYCDDGYLADRPATLASIGTYVPDAIGPGRGMH